jgi:hypothetical protein
MTQPAGWRRWILAAAIAVAAAVAAGPPGAAVEIEDGGDFTFDIRSGKDMRLVGELSGITIKNDLPPRIGQQECARWARRFKVHPYRAVVSGNLPNRRTRVWICTGDADSRALSEIYCRQMKMYYVRHDGPVVTCRFREES